MSFFAFLKSLGRFFKRAFQVAESRGLTDDLIARALTLVKDAQVRFADNTQRREWVIAALMAAGVKESIARLAVELAVQVFKGEQQPN